ncbi:nucleolar and coiled-body phosphoprotein 1-like [Cydia pomonella]|uniref:nucleolar and coiled-body phosphoprotein 1-like n=1 Tax=Cydia pomonella TaxID=82600 RepID=UPI002ADDFE5B|nr:nucleolar and coiled-body phosphoprotein 1-like [Cydia pomonella]
MAAQEDEIKSLIEKNNELVQKVQYWKMTAAQRENEKLELMKENNELRLKVIRLKSGGAADARKLDAALQQASKQALTHLVQASSAITRSLELAKTYMRDRDGADTVSPRWSNISNSTEKVHRVPPMMMGGQSIQPVVSLSRATLNINTSRQTARSPNSSRNVTIRALPMHMLQDVYIPLTRIDMRDIPNHNENEQEAADDSGDNIPFDSSMEEVAEEPQNMTEDDDYESSPRLDIVTEDVEPESEEQTPPRPRVDNPLEGPSWLLDAPREPDSTTEEAPNTPNTDSPETRPAPSPSPSASPPASASPSASAPRMFTPTVRRRKRASTPPPAKRDSINGSLSCSRVLQVLVPKLLVPEPSSPAHKRPKPRFDAPSPNGATDSRVIVSEELEAQARERESGEPDHTPTNKGHNSQRGQSQQEGYMDHEGQTQQESYRRDSGDSCGSGAERASEGRTRRNRKPVTYKEKPLNRKLRR